MRMLISRVCLQEQRKQCFLTLAKENQSPFGLYRNPLTFCFTNPQFVLRIHDRRLVFLLSPRLSLITLQQSDELREKCFLWQAVLTFIHSQDMNS